MYLTPAEVQPRKLKGAERRLFVHATDILTSALLINHDDPDTIHTGVKFFDSQSLPNKIGLLTLTAGLLLGDHLISPTRQVDLTILAIFSFLKTDLELSLSEDDFTVNDLIYDAVVECKTEVPYGRTTLSAYDVTVWEEIIDKFVMSRLTGDRDAYDELDIFNMDPKQAADWLEHFKVTWDYYNTADLSFTKENLPDLQKTLTSLVTKPARTEDKPSLMIPVEA